MCNCNSNPATICTQCQKGNPCGCPPDYSVMPQPVPCGCCAGGLTYVGPTANWPNGYCTDGKRQIAPVPCNTCEQSLDAACVILPDIPCLGVSAGTTLAQFFANLCVNPTPIVEFFLQSIGLNPVLGSGFCQLVQNCPAPGSGTTPIIGPIVVTFP